mmetsp:Transcript_4248/g.11268  ORF Transcript_4248/g.11268 Transcript_4248/m.11268 type:complete len:346 (+) Transcript_4248:430-1467(+)
MRAGSAGWKEATSMASCARLPTARAIAAWSSVGRDCSSGSSAAMPPAAESAATPPGASTRLESVSAAAPRISPLVDAPAAAAAGGARPPGGGAVGARRRRKPMRAPTVPAATRRGRTWPWPPARFWRRRRTAMSWRSPVSAVGGTGGAGGSSARTSRSLGTVAVSKRASTSCMQLGSSGGREGDISCCDMIARARTAAVRVGSEGACSSCRMGCSAPSDMSALRKSAAHASEPSTAAAEAWTSNEPEESSEMSGRCQPDERNVAASDCSTPRLPMPCTAHSCTCWSECRRSSERRWMAPASRSASRLDSERESDMTACAAWTSTATSGLARSATSGWMVMRSMVQ